MSESDAPDSASTPEESPRIDRRTAIKKAAVGAAAAGVVWSAPRIEGLTLRPNYAAAATGGGPCIIDVPVGPPTAVRAREDFSIACGTGNVTGAVNLQPGGSVAIADSIFYNGAGSFDFNCSIAAPGGWSVGSAASSFCDATGPATDSVTWHFEFNCT